MTAHTPGSPTGAPQDDAQPTETHGDGGDAGRAPARVLECCCTEGCMEQELSDECDRLTAELERCSQGRETEQHMLRNAVRQIQQLTAERDRARATAVLLEAELERARAMVRSLAPRGSGLLPRDGAE